MKVQHCYTNRDVENTIQKCSEKGHVQQVAYSTYHSALTQVCFTCEYVRTGINPEELGKGEASE